MFLASVEGIRKDLGFDAMPDINSSIAMALNAAEPLLEAKLNTSFKRSNQKDTFFIKHPTIRDGAHKETQFWLSKGFVSAPVKFNGTVKTDIRIDLEKGILSDWVTDYYHEHVEITYDYGFDTDSTNPDQYDLTQVPVWLQEAAKLIAMTHLASSTSVQETGTNIDVSTLSEQYKTIVNAHIRYAPLALIPV